MTMWQWVHILLACIFIYSFGWIRPSPWIPSKRESSVGAHQIIDKRGFTDPDKAVLSILMSYRGGCSCFLNFLLIIECQFCRNRKTVLEAACKHRVTLEYCLAPKKVRAKWPSNKYNKISEIWYTAKVTYHLNMILKGCKLHSCYCSACL